MGRVVFKKGIRLMSKNNFIVPLDCSAADAAKTTINGCGSKACAVLKELRKKNKENNVELSFLHDRKYYVKCNGKEGIIDVPQEISTMGLLLMMEYLNRSPIVCSTCRVCLKTGQCPKTLFI